MVAQAARMVGGRHKAMAKGIHLCQRRHLAGVAEIIRVFAACERRAGSRLNGKNLRVGFAGQFIAHIRCNQSAEVRAAARAADDDIRGFAQNIHCGLGFQANNGLVQQHLIEYRAEHIAVIIRGNSLFDGFRNGAAQRTGRFGKLSEDFPSNFSGGRGGRRNIRVKYAHDGFAEGLLLIRALDHIHL